MGNCWTAMRKRKREAKGSIMTESEQAGNEIQDHTFDDSAAPAGNSSGRLLPANPPNENQDQNRLSRSFRDIP